MLDSLWCFMELIIEMDAWLKSKKHFFFVPVFLPLAARGSDLPPLLSRQTTQNKRHEQKLSNVDFFFFSQLSVPLTAEANRKKIKYQLCDCYAGKNKYSSENWIQLSNFLFVTLSVENRIVQRYRDHLKKEQQDQKNKQTLYPTLSKQKQNVFGGSLTDN